MRFIFLGGFITLFILVALVAQVYPAAWFSIILLGPMFLLGLYDILQTKHAVLRNFPLVGHFRYLFEMIRPEIAQYFIESDTDGKPFSRDQRSVVYQRAKDVRDTVPFGTLRDVYAVGYEWVNHSIAPTHVTPHSLRTMVGSESCKQPYSASLFNISAMSYGSLSKVAVQSLNEGAKMGSFAHNTGEGGISPYHLSGGDLIWQIGTGYFGCRNAQGNFSPEAFHEEAIRPEVKMIELKLSQGAKPGHGGILPASKLTPEIAKIRKVGLGKDVLSPPGHSAFSTPVGLLEFIQKLRELSDGKPVGFKLCIGKRREFIAICKAIRETGITPDFIAIDGGEGGTGAAPLEFSNNIGSPLIEGLVFAHNALVGYSLRSQIRLIASGKVTTGIAMVKRLAVGADICYSARAMMMALGCIQALKCNSNHCPVGVATQNPELMRGLVVSDKNKRVANFHKEHMESVAEILGAMGLNSPDELRPWHLLRRTDTNTIKHYGEIYDYLDDGELLQKKLPPAYERACEAASADSFANALGTGE